MPMMPTNLLKASKTAIYHGLQQSTFFQPFALIKLKTKLSVHASSISSSFQVFLTQASIICTNFGWQPCITLPLPNVFPQPLPQQATPSPQSLPQQCALPEVMPAFQQA